MKLIGCTTCGKKITRSTDGQCSGCVTLDFLESEESETIDVLCRGVDFLVSTHGFLESRIFSSIEAKFRRLQNAKNTQV